MLRQLVEKSGGGSGNEERGVDEGDDARSIRTIVLHELERVGEEDEGQIAGQEKEQEQRQEEERQPGWTRKRRRRGAEGGSNLGEQGLLSHWAWE
jgi:hypothetical protein